MTLTRDIKSLRAYPYIDDIWRMIARTAYTQLRYSPFLLAGTVFGMIVLFLMPMLFPVTGWPLAAGSGACNMAGHVADLFADDPFL